VQLECVGLEIEGDWGIRSPGFGPHGRHESTTGRTNSPVRNWPLSITLASRSAHASVGFAGDSTTDCRGVENVPVDLSSRRPIEFGLPIVSKFQYGQGLCDRDAA
jgi:hypothetical protein